MDEIEVHVADLEILLEQGDYPEIIFRARTLLESDSCLREPRIWRLLGVALGRSGEHLAAKDAFLSAYDLSKSDLDVSNAIGTLFPLEEIALVLKIIDDSFRFFTEGSQELIAQNALAAIRVDLISMDDLPRDLRTYLRNVATIGHA